MNKKIFLPFLGLLLVSGYLVISSCQKDAKPTAAKPDYSFIQEFDSMPDMLRQGWVAVNNSRPLGTTTWSTGDYHWNNDPKKGISAVGAYPAYSSSHSGRDFVACLNNCQDDPALPTDPKGNASCWLLSPSVPMKDGDKIVFYTRTADQPSALKDKMEVRLNFNNAGTNVGNDWNTIGDFTKVALIVNENFTNDGYPGGDPATSATAEGWKRYEYTISGMPIPKRSRFAFRYFVPDAGPNGTNGTGVGVDAVEFISKYIP